MSTIIKFELAELRKLANDKNSSVIEKKVTQSLALQPWCLGNLKESVKNLLDYKIGKFDKEFEGILLSYKNLRVCNIGSIRNDNANITFQVQADYFIFQPHVGAMLRGIVNKKSNTHLSILVHRVFNVVIPRPTEEPGDKWIGASVREGQEVPFRIVVLDLFGALPYIRGELDEKSLEMFDNIDARASTNGCDSSKSRLSDPIVVSYVNFDKIKPPVQSHSDDDEELPEAPKNIEKQPKKSSNSSDNETKKIKTKRKSKDLKSNESPAKKIKKN